ncbi:MAG: peptidylprolyl isomerase [Sphingomonadaceae bacterium]|nr:peptidylprolyl isomerase [Sphingomonadaceae bacterium]
MTKRYRKTLMALGAILIAPSPIAAQTASGGPSSANNLNLPAQITTFGKADQNVRKATAIVNGDVITGTDVDQRLALVLLANGGRVSDEEKERLRVQVLRNLIDESLQIQEAKSNEITIDKAEINQSFARVATNFRQSIDAFGKYLRDNRSSERTMKRQIEGELAWSRLLRRRVEPFINVSDEEVKQIVDRLTASKGTSEYRVSEIYLSATPENSAEIFANGRRIIDQIRQGGSFQAYARQFSEASTAAVGGDLGWVRAAQLPEQLAQAAQEITVGQIAGPIEIPGGFSILYLTDTRQVLVANPRDAVLNLRQLTITFDAKETDAQVRTRAEAFGKAAQDMQGCGGADALAKQFNAEVVDNDQIRVRDLPGGLQDILLNLQVGQVTPPFGSRSEGVRVLALCGRDDPQVADGPSADAIENQIRDERVNRRAQIYLRDLRRDAIIDYR